VSTIKQKLGLTEAVAQKAANNYSKALSMQLVRGRSISGMVVASMYLACKEFNTPKNISELSMVIDANPKSSRHCYNILVRRFKVTPANVNLDVYLNRAANTLEIRGKAYRRSLDFLNVVKGHHISQGKNPRAIAAASIYLAIRSLKEHSITMAKIANALDVSVVSVRKRVADIAKHCPVGEMNKEDADRSQNDGAPSRVACTS
jgi:transcription initiation factor TFIIB